MERLRIFCKKAFSYPAKLHKTHPVTAIAVTVSTIMFAVHLFILAVNDYADNGLYMELFFCLCMASLYFSVFALCIESIRPRWSTKPGVMTFSAFGLVGVFMALVDSDLASHSHKAFFNFLADTKDRLGSTTVFLYIAGLMALAILLAVYFSYSRDIGEAFNKHIISIFSRIFFLSIIYGVIQLGVIFLTVIVNVLLYDDAFEFLPSILVLINGLFYVPAVLYAITHENEKPNFFIEVIVRYVSLVITLISFCIIYIYMIKLIATGSVPSNSVYEILVALFILSMTISYMSTAYEEKGILQKFAYNCPLIFAPFIIMQSYTAIIRIGQYGLTPKRYFGIAFIAFEIFYIVYYYYIRKTEKEIAGRGILLIMCAFIMICIFCPGLSGRGLSTAIAKHRLSSYLDKRAANEPIADREYVRINAAYGFLKDEDFGKDRLVKYFPSLTEDQVADMKATTREAAKRIDSRSTSSSEEEPYKRSRYGWFDAQLGELGQNGHLDISGYNSVSQITITDSDSSDEESPIDTSKLTILGGNPDDVSLISRDASIDLSDLCGKFAELTIQKEDGIITESEYNSRCRKNCVMDINENVRICITNANITINKDDKVSDINMDAFLFVK